MDKFRLSPFSFSQDKVVDGVNDGIANAKAAAESASKTVNENVETLKDKACKSCFSK